MMNMTKIKLPVLALSVLFLAACESEPSDDLQDSIVESTATSNFDLANSVIPFPNDLLFAGSTDGTINITGTLTPPQIALNALDGFSTVAPMTTGFTGEIDSGSLNGDSIKLYEVTLSPTAAPRNQGGAAVAINNELVYGVDYVGSVSSVDTSGESLAIVPLKPLNPSSAYYVVITNSLNSDDGNNMGVSSSYALTKVATPIVVGGVSQIPTLTDAEAAALEPVRQLISTSEATLGAFDSNLDTGDIILSWLFSTQAVGDVLTVARGLAGTPAINNLTAFAGDLFGMGAGVSPMGAANIFTADITIPYYLTAPSVGNPTANLTKSWLAANEFPPASGLFNLTGANPLPAKTADLDIPLMITTPRAIAAPWKTVIFQHGITTNRTTILAVADALALAGFAVVSIDMPLHGVDSTSPFYQAGKERTFEVDFATQDANGSITAAAPDGTVDSSGLHYINLTNLLVQRDNLRQSVADLFALNAAIPTIDVDGGGADLSTGATAGEIYFLGHSLGAMVGTTFTALETTVKDAVFVFNGTSLPKILDGSASFSPTIVAGLAASGVIKGTADYESFLGAAQTAVDAGDPVNFATAAATGRGVVSMEIVGGNTSPSDLTVPNTVPDSNDSSNTVPAPLAGTEPSLALMGLTQVNSDQTGTDLHHSVKFVVGNHSSLLSPAADDFNDAATNLAVTTELQTIAATFFATDGASVDITNDTLIAAP